VKRIVLWRLKKRNTRKGIFSSLLLSSPLLFNKKLYDRSVNATHEQNCHFTERQTRRELASATHVMSITMREKDKDYLSSQLLLLFY
jgi:hypothetical protein